VARASRSRRPPTRAKQPPRAPLLVISVPSQTSFLGLIREITQKLAEGAGFDPATSGKLALAVDEAATNVIEHAYAGAPDRELELRYDNRPREFRVDVVDNGAMVDPRAVPRVDLDRYVSERRTGGLGVHLMEKIMDSVTFRRSARRNVCCMVKLKDRGAPGTGE
jgi:anti-sigma regulatory factor (Ser/Thr protein kinase)